MIQLFQKNNANIIWVDNPYTNLNSITNLLNTIKKETDYSIITILPILLCELKTEKIFPREFIR